MLIFIVRFGVVAASGQQMKDLYNYIEVDFHPLQLCNKVNIMFKEIYLTAESDDQLYESI